MHAPPSNGRNKTHSSRDILTYEVDIDKDIDNINRQFQRGTCCTNSL